jgi:hypothetical protein
LNDDIATLMEAIKGLTQQRQSTSLKQDVSSGTGKQQAAHNFASVRTNLYANRSFKSFVK